MQTFMTVYETRNFSVAAKQLFISQPSVSVQINRLEQTLDMTLFVRNGRRQVQPTPAADQLYLPISGSMKSGNRLSWQSNN
ncbi:LysR family transcriptional regulator [Secundilactobacillus paracollinoides]|uniref:LysR family transcriptional regulator n=1 Tax=Secundilactobacillus paracollinoides TaxID=240427 RepID=UPI000AB09703|nr:LysR family transcriptional regulator [Secundilactobacillus paracollinoides]